MTFSRDKLQAIVAVAVIVLSGAVLYLFVMQPRIGQPPVNPMKNLPVSGYAPNDTGGKVPGNPQNGVDDLRLIYKILTKYKAQSDDACRVSKIDTRLNDVMMNPTKYGLRDIEEFTKLLSNPDDIYGDTAKDRAGSIIPYQVHCFRPDGTMTGSAKKSGERDVLAFSKLYVHQNIRYFPHEGATYNPVGFYLVLWDDGQIEKIPYYDVLHTRTKDGKLTLGFRGQAGLSKELITYDDNWRELGFEKGPRGTVGGKGVSNDPALTSGRK